MECPPSHARPDFDLHPKLACSWLANEMAQSSPSATEGLDYLLYQYSSTSTFTLFDEHLSGLVQAVLELPQDKADIAWCCLLSWVQNFCPNRTSQLFSLSTSMGIQAQDNRWLMLRWKDMGEAVQYGQINPLPENLSTAPVLTGLFPLGSLIVNSLRSPPISKGWGRQNLLRNLDEFIKWGGESFSSYLSQEDVEFISTCVRDMDLSAFVHVRSLSVRCALIARAAPAAHTVDLPGL